MPLLPAPAQVAGVEVVPWYSVSAHRVPCPRPAVSSRITSLAPPLVLALPLLVLSQVVGLPTRLVRSLPNDVERTSHPALVVAAAPMPTRTTTKRSAWPHCLALLSVAWAQTP